MDDNTLHEHILQASVRAGVAAAQLRHAAHRCRTGATKAVAVEAAREADAAAVEVLDAAGVRLDLDAYAERFRAAHVEWSAARETELAEAIADAADTLTAAADALTAAIALLADAREVDALRKVRSTLRGIVRAAVVLIALHGLEEARAT